MAVWPLWPADDVNLHFTGDMPAVTSAHNLLAALIDNHVKRHRAPLIDPGSLSWKRVIDLNDKGLAHIITGLDDVPQAPLRETGFDLTASSAVMAIIALADGLPDLRRRLGQIIVGESPTGAPVRADDIGATGAMTALLRDGIRPNLVQTCERTAALVHAGPFANIAHGNYFTVGGAVSVLANGSEMDFATRPSPVEIVEEIEDFLGLARPPCSSVRKSICTSVPRPSPLSSSSGCSVAKSSRSRYDCARLRATVTYRSNSEIVPSWSMSNSFASGGEDRTRASS